jgi:serine/threonine-protein kinase
MSRLELPATIGKYELLEFLGGGMSHVYRGRDTVIDRPVAVKILTADACGDPDAKARFLQEARLAGNIQHENIVSVFDYGEHLGRPFIVMEYLKGEDLRHAIRAGRLRGLEHRLRVALDVAAALEYVHGRAIVHRDIKPENIHIADNGKVKLMDFGIAKTADLSLTKAGLAMGTPYYMAPEQVSGQPATALVDIYAYGLLLFEILTGKRAVTGETMETVFYQILNVPVDEQAMENAGVPPPVRELVRRSTAKDPGQRLANFGLVCGELRRILMSSGEGRTQPLPPSPEAQTLPVPVAPQPGPPAPARKQKTALWIAAALLAGAAGGGGWWWWTGRSAPAIPGMMYIPAGTFLRGPQNQPTPAPAFYIDEAEVTNADFAAYCRATGCQAPEGAPDLPVVKITVAQARAYAQWRGKRLPTALEWERAARGPEGLLFPWGDQMDAAKANVADNSALGGKGLISARSLAGFPAFHLIGNAWEMVEGRVSPSQEALDNFATQLSPAPSAQEPWIAIRGGSFREKLTPALTYDWGSIPERFSSDLIGFRCARDP